MAHGAKGVAAAAAAQPLMDILQKLETEAQSGEWDNIKNMAGMAKVEFSHVVEFYNDRREGS